MTAHDLTSGFMNADQQAYRDAMQLLAGGVTVVTTAANGRLSGFTATAVMSLSSEPPLIALGVNRDGFSYRLIAESRRFCVNILDEGQRRAAEIFAGRVPEGGDDRFRDVAWTRSPLGCPALAGALACFDCRVEDDITAATHALIVGKVEHVATRPAGAPMVYWARDFRRIERSR